MNLGLQQALQAFLGGGNGFVLQADDKEKYRHDGPVEVLTGSSSGHLAARLHSGGFTSIQEFALLRSARTTRWIIPIGPRTHSGLHIYKPYAPRARVLTGIRLNRFKPDASFFLLYLLSSTYDCLRESSSRMHVLLNFWKNYLVLN